ncbi:DUF551 domain-containing protein [Escherichia coli]|uniref:DUF551 domain-containing protein n=1 Tax=Escherichia coli TaxID=562 RepID=UPI001FF0F612|nr:DUF551 domain-containing protein [Escherichia coli]
MSNIDKRALRHSAESIIGILENIAGFEPSDIDGDSVELRFETEDGFDTGCDVSIVDQCQKTADVVRALLDELDKWQQESSAWQAVAEKQLALAADAEKRIAELESLTAPRLPQPSPVSVPEVVCWEDVPEEITEDDIVLASAWAHGFNQCRAAMLQGAEPVSQTYKLNELSGNSPVTPDGWISCSKRMPDDTKMLLAFSQGQIVAAYWNWVMSPIDYKKYRAFTYLSGNILDDVTHWMPLPEPPQEVNRG